MFFSNHHFMTFVESCLHIMWNRISLFFRYNWQMICFSCKILTSTTQNINDRFFSFCIFSISFIILCKNIWVECCLCYLRCFSFYYFILFVPMPDPPWHFLFWVSTQTEIRCFVNHCQIWLEPGGFVILGNTVDVQHMFTVNVIYFTQNLVLYFQMVSSVWKVIINYLQTKIRTIISRLIYR
jgi:hypothetical protein